MLLVYRRYYGIKLAALLGVVLYIAMAITGFVVDLIFAAGGWVPDASTTSVESMNFFAVDYTFWLNLIFAVVGFGLWRLSKQAPQAARGGAHHGHHH